MAGTREGGLKAAKTNKERYGDDYYTIRGRNGGLKSRGGGFAANPELARIAGAKGGRNSKRGKAKQTSALKATKILQAELNKEKKSWRERMGLWGKN